MGELSDYIQAQPTVAARCLAFGRETFASIDRLDFSAIALIGSGSSFNALVAAEPSFRSAPRGPVRIFNPLDFISALGNGECRDHLVVVLSQSGRSQTSIAATQAAAASGLLTLVLTADRSAPIAEAGGRLIAMPIPAETLGPKTMGYAGSLATVLALAEALGAPLPVEKESEALLRAALDVARPAAEGFLTEMDTVDYLVTGASERHYGTALEATLKLTEIAGLPAAAFPTEELLHGRLHAMSARSAALLFAQTPEQLQDAVAAVEAMRALAIRAWTVNLTDQSAATDCWIGPPPVPAPLDTLSALFAFQWLANAMAPRRGLVPGAMKYPGLSQRLQLKSPPR